MGHEKLVCFDPGHSYTSSNRSPDARYYEWLGCQDICEKAMLLTNNIPGLRGMLTKETWELVGLAERVKRAHDAGACLFLSQHTNAFGTGGWQSPNGYGVYPYPDKNIDLAEIALGECDRVIGHLMNSRGIRPANFYVTRETRMPALLFETGFHTNQHDVALLKTHEFRYLAAEVLVRTACTYLGISYIGGKGTVAGYHVVERGDRFGRIASDRGISIAELSEFNPHIPDPAVIYAEHGGDIIWLEAPNATEVDYGFYRRNLILCNKDKDGCNNDIKILEDQLRHERLEKAKADAELKKVKDAGKTLILNTTTKLESYASIFE